MNKFKLILLVIVVLTLTGVINARAATFESDDTTYVINEAALKCSLDDNALLVDVKDEYYIFIGLNLDENTERFYYYKLDFNGNCSILDGQDYLDLMNESTYKNSIDFSGRVYESVYYYDYCTEYFKTKDTTINPQKYYYIINEDGIYERVFSPEEANISTYYEYDTFKYPDFITIDEDLEYYEYELIPGVEQYRLVPVENPTSENILKYRVVADNEASTSTQIDTVDLSKIPNLSEPGTGISISIIDDEYFIFVIRNSNSAREVYDKNGNRIEKLTGTHHISKMNNGLYFVELRNDLDYSSRIYNADYELLYELEGEMDLIQNTTNNNVDYIGTYDDRKVYTLKGYKEINKTKHNFVDTDLVFTFNGKLENLNSVKINDVELDTDNYTKASGSTIITLKKEYMQTLKNGSYTLKVGYNDGGSAKTTFEITNSTIKDEESNPKTGDMIVKLLVISSVSLISLLEAGLYIKRSIRNN